MNYNNLACITLSFCVTQRLSGLLKHCSLVHLDHFHFLGCSHLLCYFIYLFYIYEFHSCTYIWLWKIKVSIKGNYSTVSLRLNFTHMLMHAKGQSLILSTFWSEIKSFARLQQFMGCKTTIWWDNRKETFTDCHWQKLWQC